MFLIPVRPSDFKSVIPNVGGSFCEKFLNSLRLPNLVYLWVSYIWNEDGSFTDDFQADICNLSCKCAGGAIPGTGLASPIVSASDGQYADKVQITWTAVTNALQYDLYRSNTNDPNTATVLGANLQATSYDDTTVTPGTYYYYWAKAKNSSAASGFSAGDRGHAGSIATTLTAITDLVATQGIQGLSPTYIGLVFSPVSGAETYDFYRNTVDDFATATLISAGRAPYDNSNSYGLGTPPYFVDNNGELLFLHDPGSPQLNYYTKYYFWVVAKRSGPPAQSGPSNTALGWAIGKGDGTPVITGITLQDAAGAGAGSPYTVPSGITKVWFAHKGSGAGGAGGGPVHGGGGGGAGPVLTGWVNVVAGAKFRIKSTPASAGTSQAASEVNGSNGSVSELEYSALGTFADTVVLSTGNAPSGGVYNAGGAGTGGAGSTGTKHASVQEGAIYAGRAGRPATTPKGGRSGYRIGETRKLPAADGTQGAPAGSGGTANASAGLRAAGRGVNGIAYLVTYA